MKFEWTIFEHEKRIKTLLWFLAPSCNFRKLLHVVLKSARGPQWSLMNDQIFSSMKRNNQGVYPLIKRLFYNEIFPSPHPIHICFHISLSYYQHSIQPTILAFLWTSAIHTGTEWYGGRDQAVLQRPRASSHYPWAEENSVAGSQLVLENPTYDQGGECQRATTFHTPPPVSLILCLPKSLGSLGIRPTP